MDRLCKRCLFDEMTQKELIKTVNEYIQSLDDEAKIDEESYQKRLDICSTCEKLINGMCRVCGCFAEVRAVKKNGYCPDVAKRW